MKYNKILTIGCIAVLGMVAVGNTTVVNAEEEENNTPEQNESLTSETTKINTTINGGDITIGFNRYTMNFAFDLKEAASIDKFAKSKEELTSNADTELSGLVVDLRGVDTKWQLNAKLDKFSVDKQHEDDSINNSSIQFNAGNSESIKLEPGKTEVPVTNGGGSGALDTELAFKDFEMTIPVEHSYAGKNIKSVITWNLVDAPTE
ncbi:hypothetical protein E0T48_002704 [Enterococcus faecalis]|uniref:hypothetical protein n=1 Tax=Enterococcus faecalis TaxID=1351 RepID=UPI000CF62BC9|nr:hypothetical protein [Enterococcus faecalis]EGO5243402.1 hypothetical protein [Enterococcus faecalis]EHK9982426.1 hypothetical protein [Enterococcus faecalis]PQC11815.1 hypothetical protein CUM91_11885 [Enterococcus faecalis]HAP3814271.1 hypothetical protein [Enterococcus faecalis]HAP3825342.1 hypothetical protein [Enterococcus faecalis]